MSGSARRLLLIAFHFPPIQGSTGVTRTLAFAKYLRDCGWEVTVLTAHPRAYPESRAENLAIIPPHVRVERAAAFDTRRHLSLAGKYPLALAVPDRWQSWIAGGFLRARRVIRQWRPDVIMSTYPIASAHYLGHLVHKWSGLPWVADFRDPMAQEGYPPEPRLQRAYQRIEQHVFANAARVIATTAGTAELYRERFPAFPAANIVVIPNGFDDELFPAPTGTPPAARPERRKLSLLHSGVLYPSERDPLEFFAAVAELRDAGALRAEDVEFRLRATGHDELYAPRLEQFRLNDLVRLLPPVPYKEALAEMSAVDACMVFQGSNCNQQVPAKVYEYLYAGRPVLGLAEPAGDTGRLLADFGIRHIVSLHDRAAIRQLLPGFLAELRADSIEPVERGRVLGFSRRATTRSLGELLDGVLSQRQLPSRSMP